MKTNRYLISLLGLKLKIYWHWPYIPPSNKWSPPHSMNSIISNSPLILLVSYNSLSTIRLQVILGRSLFLCPSVFQFRTILVTLFFSQEMIITHFKIFLFSLSFTWTHSTHSPYKTLVSTTTAFVIPACIPLSPAPSYPKHYEVAFHTIYPPLNPSLFLSLLSLGFYMKIFLSAIYRHPFSMHV